MRLIVRLAISSNHALRAVLEEGLEERGGLGEDRVRTGGWALVGMAAIVVRALVVNALVGMALLALQVLVGMALLGNTIPISAIPTWPDQGNDACLSLVT